MQFFSVKIVLKRQPPPPPPPKKKTTTNTQKQHQQKQYFQAYKMLPESINTHCGVKPV